MRFTSLYYTGADNATNRPRQDPSTQPSANRLLSTQSFEDSTTRRRRSSDRSSRARQHFASPSPCGESRSLSSTIPYSRRLTFRVCLPNPYPILSTASPIFRSMTPSGRPLILELPTPIDPLSPAGLFGLPPPLFSTLASTYFVQPTSIPLLTTLSTSPSARYLLSHLSTGLKELQRVRSSCLYDYEEGEYAIGRDGLAECRERLETLADNHGAAAGGIGSDSEGSAGEDEDWEME